MEQPNYFAIIPADVRYADILGNAKLLYGEITALASKEGYCWASDAYFASLYKVTRQTANSWVNILKEKGFIKIQTTKNENGTARKIYLTRVSRKPDTGVSRKPDTSNTYISNTNNTITNVIGQKPQFGDVNVNTVMDSLYSYLEVKPVRVKAQRIAATNLIRRHGLDNALGLVKAAIYLQQTDKYAYRISSMEDLWNKQNNILMAIKKQKTNQVTRI